MLLQRVTSLFCTNTRLSKFAFQQSFSLVNVKLKLVKDRALDAVIEEESHLKIACELKDKIASAPNGCLPIYVLNRRRRQLGLSDERVISFMRRYPTLFDEFSVPGLGERSCPVPWFRLSEQAQQLHQEELNVINSDESEVVDRLRKLLMLTRERSLPLITIKQLQWDMGLPMDFHDILIPRYPQYFCLSDDILHLLVWEDHLAVSQLQKQENILNEQHVLSFPIKFTKGFGLNRKCMKWLVEWQKLPYTCPYEDSDHLDPRTDVSEKRNVAMFHELLHLTIEKKIERKNVRNLRRPFGLPHKFTKVFERHPGIFYISRKRDTQTIMLREAYDGSELIHKHPLIGIRKSFANLMRTGMLNRSRGLYKKKHQYDDGHD